MYDSSIGRWNGVDALAEKYAGWSPFNYVMGNPIVFVDPDGNRIAIRDENGNKYRYKNGELYARGRKKSKEAIDKSTLTGSIDALVNALDKINTTKQGKNVIQKLDKSIRGHKFTSEKPKTRGNSQGLETKGRLKGLLGSKVRYGNLETIKEDARELGEAAVVDAVSNELFHSFQAHVLAYDRSTTYEFQSDIFSTSIVEALGYESYVARSSSNYWGDDGLKDDIDQIKSSTELNKKLYKKALKKFQNTSPRGLEIDRRNDGFSGKLKPKPIKKLLPLK